MVRQGCNRFLLYVGVEGISNKLKVDLTKGLSGDSFPARTEFFGNNYRDPIKAKSFCTIFFEALDDFMLKVLIVAATGSLIFEYIGADPEDYGHGKCISYGPKARYLLIRGSSSLKIRSSSGWVHLLGARSPLYRNKINYNV